MLTLKADGRGLGLRRHMGALFAEQAQEAPPWAGGGPARQDTGQATAA